MAAIPDSRSSMCMRMQGTSVSPAATAARSRRSPAMSSYWLSLRRTDRGCSTPWLRMDSVSSSNASREKNFRGWAGFGRMFFTGRNTTLPVSM